MSGVFFCVSTYGVTSLFSVTAMYSLVKRYHNLLLGFQQFCSFTLQMTARNILR